MTDAYLGQLHALDSSFELKGKTVGVSHIRSGYAFDLGLSGGWHLNLEFVVILFDGGVTVVKSSHVQERVDFEWALRGVTRVGLLMMIVDADIVEDHRSHILFSLPLFGLLSAHFPLIGKVLFFQNEFSLFGCLPAWL